MKKISIFLATLCMVCLALTVNAQHYKYIDSTKVMGIKSYARQIKEQPGTQLVEIKKYIPEITLDIRYATTNNFMHRQMYPEARAFARLPVVMALKDVEADLKTRGLGIIIY